MADSGRQEKLAAARKKLKKFQQKRTTPVTATSKSNSDSLDGSPGQHYNSTDNNGISLQDAVYQPLDQRNGDFPEAQQERQSIQKTTVPREMFSPKEKENSTSDKIKELCKKVNGLVNQDLLINGEDPIFKDIEALELENCELEESLQSHKRSNQQLSHQVNEQRKQIIQLQEQLKKERTELANKQLLGQRSLQEKLEVHIQTIGILVGEKQELQASLSQFQKKYEIKQNETIELNSRLQTVRQKAAELERNVANLSASYEKCQEDLRQARQDRDKHQTSSYSHNREKEDLAQQNSELRVKLEVKVKECEDLESNSSELAFKLKQAELIVQQLSAEPNASETHAAVQELQQDKADLDSKLEQANQSLQRIAAEKSELLQRHSDLSEEYDKKVFTLNERIEQLEREHRLWIANESELQENVFNLQKELENLRDAELNQQLENTQLAAAEIEKLVEEKQRLGQHLQDQSRENNRLIKEQQQFLHRIHELEASLARLGEEAVDKATLLESVQSDKETISRALKQNKELKTQLEELEGRFVNMSENNMELTSNLETEKHVSIDMSEKLSTAIVELEETKETLRRSQLEAVNYKNNSEQSLERVQLLVRSQTQEIERLLEEKQTLEQQLQEEQHTENSKETTESETSEESEQKIKGTDHSNGVIKNGEQIHEEQVEEERTNAEREEVGMDYRNGDVQEEDWPTESDSSEEMNMAPLPPPPASKYTSRTDVMDSLSASIRQLEMERDQLTSLLQQSGEHHESEMNKLQEHMELQVKQQLQQQYRQVQEMYQQQLHEQQHKITLLQDLLEQQRESTGRDTQDEYTNLDESVDELTPESLKMGFSKLKTRFVTLMNEKATLLDKLQEMEHLNTQLAEETETIGEYIALYHTQRNALKTFYRDQQKLVTQISNEKANMQNKMHQLEVLVKDLLQDRTSLRHEQHNLRSLLNQKLLAHEHEQTIPGLQEGDEILTPQSDGEISTSDFGKLDYEQESVSEFELSSTPVDEQDGKEQQILQLFEQLVPSGEGSHEGWLSPAVRNREFLPCRSCAGVVQRL